MAKRSIERAAGRTGRVRVVRSPDCRPGNRFRRRDHQVGWTARQRRYHRRRIRSAKGQAPRLSLARVRFEDTLASRAVLGPVPADPARCGPQARQPQRCSERSISALSAAGIWALTSPSRAYLQAIGDSCRIAQRGNRQGDDTGAPLPCRRRPMRSAPPADPHGP